MPDNFNHMKRFACRLLFSSLLFISVVAASQSIPPHAAATNPIASRPGPAHPDPADEVDPLIGTAKSIRPTMWESNGATFPGVLAPFGMVQITPDGYHYTDTHIRGFSYLDHSSGWGSSGRFLILPYTGPVAGPAAFTHAHEEAHPWRYDVDLTDEPIHASFTATLHVGFARFAFPASTQTHIRLSDVSKLTIVADTILTGCCQGTWFTAHFSRPFRVGRIDSTQIILDFTTTAAARTIDIRTGFSTTSLTAAAANLREEMPTNDFEKYSREGRHRWNQTLSLIEIKGGDEAHLKVFYTALYHSCFMPAILSDAGVSPRRYTPLYPWDTYRSEHPLITLLDPTAEGEMIASTLSEYDNTGWLPTGNMLGNHNVELILDSYIKGVHNFDAGKAATAIRKSLLTAPYARRDMSLFNTLGYVPAAHVNSVSQTLEFAYDCWAAATFLQIAADHASRTDQAVPGDHPTTANQAALADIDTLLARSYNYQNSYDPETGFMRAKTDSGTWTDGGYCEGTPWTYTWFVPHDVRGLVNLMGGVKHFSDKLTECFDKGYYIHDNEPPLHYAYLFDYIGQPWKTQQYARNITEISYSPVPGGLPGNDDLGALSSWYVFSAMGFYPATPGQPIYELGSPVFEQCILHLPNGKTFTIRAPGTSSANRYIRSATLNGRPYNRPWLAHEEILAGGTLTLEMGPLPNKQWAAAPDNAPPSQTTGHPIFTFTPPTLSTSTSPSSAAVLSAPADEPTTPAGEPTIPAGEPAQWSCRISNDGPAAGSIQLDLFVDGHPYRTQKTLINAGDTIQLSIPVIIYQAGPHTITLGQTAFPQKLVVKAKPPTFVYSELTIPLPPVITQKDSLPVSVKIKNTGSAAGATRVVLYVDRRPIESRTIQIDPGQEKIIRFLLAAKDCQPPSANNNPRPLTRDSPSLSTITINDLPPVCVRILDGCPLPPIDTKLLDRLNALTVLNFDEGPTDKIPDASGKGNIGIVHGSPHWVTGLFGKAIQLDAPHGSYIELQASKGLDTLTHSSSMTMMAWIYPMEEENFSDVVCKGDWHTLQLKASNTVVNFYTAGWEGHEAFAPTPANWNRHWHHIAGVTRYPYEELYIDGRLAATKHMEPRDPAGETGLSDYSNHPWSIGRNDGDPTRLFKGYIDDVMIFGKALTPDEINKLMLHLP